MLLLVVVVLRLFPFVAVGLIDDPMRDVKQTDTYVYMVENPYAGRKEVAWPACVCSCRHPSPGLSVKPVIKDEGR